MMNAGLPAYMIRGEKQTIVATVTNLTEKAIVAEVKADAEGGIFSGKNSGTVQLNPGKSAHLYFTVIPSVNADQKSCAVDLQVKGGGLSDGVKTRIPLTFFGRDTVQSASARLENENDQKTATINMPDKFTETKLDVRLSPGSGEALRQSLAYLADYPYGCIEQTMSRFMPLLAAKQAGYISPKLKDNLSRMVNEGIRLIKEHQKDDGGFGWYGEDGTDAMMSAYVYRGLVLAGKNSQSIDKNIATRTRYFLYSALDRGVKTSFEKAYIMFCLSEGEKLEKSMVDSLVRETSREGLYTRTLTALVLFNQGEKERASALTNECLKEYKKQKDPMNLFAEKDQWDADTAETTASLLTAVVRTGVGQSDAEKLSANLISLRNGLAWKNSRDTAWAVLALAEKIQKFRETGKPSAIQISVNGQNAVSVSVTSAEVDNGSTKINIPAGVLKKGPNEIKIEKNGGGAVYATVIAKFTDISASLPSLNNGFKVERSYYKVDAKTTDTGVAISLNETGNFKTGDLVMAAIHLSKKGNDGDYIMVEDAIPPGFSVVKQDGEYYSNSNAKEYSQRQVYDDRSVFFIKGPSSEAVIRYFLRADIPGVVKALPASASLMYYPEINGSSTDSQLTVGE